MQGDAALHPPAWPGAEDEGPQQPGSPMGHGEGAGRGARGAAPTQRHSAGRQEGRHRASIPRGVRAVTPCADRSSVVAPQPYMVPGPACGQCVWPVRV